MNHREGYQLTYRISTALGNGNFPNTSICMSRHQNLSGMIRNWNGWNWRGTKGARKQQHHKYAIHSQGNIGYVRLCGSERSVDCPIPLLQQGPFMCVHAQGQATLDFMNYLELGGIQQPVSLDQSGPCRGDEHSCEQNKCRGVEWVAVDSGPEQRQHTCVDRQEQPVSAVTPVGDSVGRSDQHAVLFEQTITVLIGIRGKQRRTPLLIRLGAHRAPPMSSRRFSQVQV